jgi:hypothetical protein
MILFYLLKGDTTPFFIDQRLITIDYSLIPHIRKLLIRLQRIE